MHSIVYLSVAILAVTPSIGAYALEAGDVLTIRAIREPTAQVTNLINKIAEPITVPIEKGTTLRQIVTRHCGGVSQAYTELLKNESTIEFTSLDQALEQQELKLPACLYFSNASDTSEITVRNGDTAFNLYRMRTGGGGTQQELSEYFGAPVESLERIQPGNKLATPAVTLAVPLIKRPGTDSYVQELRELDPQGLAFREAPTVQGNIAIGFASGSGNCDTPSEPMDAEAIYQAYVYSKELASNEDINVSGGRAEVAIVDNGFFGATASPSIRKAFEGSPFISKYFKSNPYFTIADNLKGIDTQPINFVYDITPTEESGHGTHVTGIALGGPSLRPYLEKMGSEPWASITILNIGRGKDTLIEGAYELLSAKILTKRPYRIVNLSLTHDGKIDHNISDSYNNIFTTAKNTLFVVAAGNNWGMDVADNGILPAALGGTNNKNVITVAAIDGSRKIAKFSNIGASSVDVAAPGCQIKSWIANNNETVAISGTSQATPAVTNEAALLLSLAINASAETLKNRSISSGDLLPSSERGKTLYEVSINPSRALLIFQDYLAVEDGISLRALLGTVQNLAPVTCQNKRRKIPKSLQDMFSIKRTEGTSYFFGGMITGSIARPCAINFDKKATVYFSATHEIQASGKIVPLPTPLEKSWPLKNVMNLVARIPTAKLN
ncbi:S8 family serine peptidase [Pseudomonas putida]|uniref:S8 family serine peptidase n=1 Tax=Pseudomonas putida TaxID=303 RepID=UPI00235B9FE4|nr:S8 family serine peptidase [Pseudomonas putida]GLO47119.1 hypothetical protein PPUN109347_36820 [Pseudomonas putida]HDS0979126.1 S8 family serine peptidase [Pseudomonas putida]